MKDFTAEFGGAEFAVLADEALVAEAHQLLRICGASVASLKDGMTFQVGWGVFRVVAEPTGYRLQAPTFAVGEQLEFGDDATTALWIHGAQLATARKGGLEPQECSYNDSLSYEKRAVRAEWIFLMRHEPSPGISGWRLGAYGAEVAPREPR